MLRDITFALRTLSKARLFVAVAVLSIAFGIGANTAIFSLTDQLLVRQLPVVHPEQLIMLTTTGRHYGSNSGMNRISYPMYQDFREHNAAFEGMFCFREADFSLSSGGRTERISGELVSGNYFPVLGVKPALGRLFTAADDLFPNSHPVVVLSYGYWQSRFAGNPGIIGSKLVVNGFPMTIVGVSQPGFTGIDPGVDRQIRVPMMMAGKMTQFSLNDRRWRWVTAFGRLKPGVSMKTAQAGLRIYFHQILQSEVQMKDFAKAAPDSKREFLRMSLDLLPAATGRSQLRRQFSKPLLVLMATVALVLLIACANVANLLIARATGRQREIAVRLALGCSRGRILSQLLVESLILSLTGGVAGLLLAIWLDRALIGFMPPTSVPLVISAIPDGRILTFNFLLSVITGIIFGLVPALQATRPRLAATLKDQAGAVAGTGATALRKALVVAQISLSLLLLIGSGLFIHSLQKLEQLDPGFRTTNLLAFKVDPTLNGYSQERTRSFYEQLKQNLESLPAVSSVSFAVVPVMEGDEWDSSVTIDSFVPKPGDEPQPHMNFMFPDYFRTMEIPLLVGRDFRMSDDQKSAKVCIVNEVFAKKYFGSVQAVGHKVGMGLDPGTKTDITIIGVARGAKYESMRDEVPPEMFRPYRQMEFASGITVYLRTPQHPEEVFNAVRQRVHQLDANLPVFEMITLEQQTANSLVTERLVASLSSVFGLLATLLASVGLYGVMAYTVARRTREIGIRMAIGASRTDVLSLVMREVVVLLLIGTAIALPASWVLSQSIRSQLYGVDPLDAFSIASALIAITTVALLAGYVPARRATRIDPMRALRYE